MRGRRSLLATSLTVVLATGCGDDGSAELSIEDPWARPTAPTADVAAFYVTIDNPSDVDDALVAATSDRCGTTEIHRTTMEDGAMSMAEAGPEDLIVAGNGSLVLEPGGLHVMCMGLAEPLAEGETVEVELVFQQAGPRELTVPVEQR